MKLKVIEIEATVDDLKASNTLADALNNQLRNIFFPHFYANSADADEEEGEE